jgi:hypothetical protein
MMFEMIREIGLAYSTYCTVPLALRPRSMIKLAGLFWSPSSPDSTSFTYQLLSMSRRYNDSQCCRDCTRRPCPLAAHLIVPLFSVRLLGARCVHTPISTRVLRRLLFALSPVLFPLLLLAPFFLGLCWFYCEWVIRLSNLALQRSCMHD